MGIGSILGTYGDFILGTGQSTVTEAITNTIKNRKTLGYSYGKALKTGITDGFKQSHANIKTSCGFLKSLKTGFSAIPNGWKAGKGFGKFTGALKGCGKAMPALFAGLTVLGEIPNIYKSVKEKGIVQGIKEVGKTVTRLTAGAVCGTILGAVLAPIPGGSIVGGMGGWMLGDWIASKIVGKSYSEQVAEQETDNQENGPKTVQNEQGDSVTFSGAEAPAVDSISYPPIDANDFGPYRPYANVFYNYPGAGADMGVRMPGQSYTGSINIAGSGIGMNGLRANNVSPNLLDKPVKGGDLLNPNQRR